MAVKIKACRLLIKACRYGLTDVAFLFFKWMHVTSDMRNTPGENTETWIHFPQEWFVPSLVKIGPVVLEKKIFKSSHPIFTFLWLSPLWREPAALYWNKLEFPLSKDILYEVWLNLVCGPGEEDFLKCSENFYSFTIISPWKRVIPFFWTNLNPLYPRMICTKSG
jgi:hypothetical protein